MHLQKLIIHNFRNIPNGQFEFHPEFNFIFGKNGQGKTNLVEAIDYLSDLKSFRGADKEDLIMKGCEFAVLEAYFVKNDLTWHVKVVLNAKGRQITVNGKRPDSRKSYHAQLPLVLFEPRDIYLFRDSPSERRRYLNRATFLQEPEQLNILRDYENVVTQKNKLLKQGVQGDFLDVWNEKLCELGAKILRARHDWMNQIKSIVAEEYHALSKKDEVLKLVYKPAKYDLPLESHPMTEGDWQGVLQQAIEKQRYQEFERRECLVGPHRDDIQAWLDDRDVGVYASQGENRSVIIALKLAQIKLYEKTQGRCPLFLLDDVASELDKERCQYLFSYLRDANSQVFLTTTERLIDDENYRNRSHSYSVSDGKIEKFQDFDIPKSVAS